MGSCAAMENEFEKLEKCLKTCEVSEPLSTQLRITLSWLSSLIKLQIHQVTDYFIFFQVYYVKMNHEYF